MATSTGQTKAQLGKPAQLSKAASHKYNALPFSEREIISGIGICENSFPCPIVTHSLVFLLNLPFIISESIVL